MDLPAGDVSGNNLFAVLGTLGAQVADEVVAANGNTVPARAKTMMLLELVNGPFALVTNPTV